MSKRLELHEILMTIPGLAGVYFQPPSTVRMKYPCIVYRKEGWNVNHADNILYKEKERYSITIIDSNPDSSFPYLLRHMFKYCRDDRTYVADNLNHYTFTLYF